ncbi:MAG: hypothetical protein KBD24_03270 [Candidatus Pacebacteria bacterium]|nr:hypothetical protein [Candidatus Paceibacterota bacterium]
MNKRPLDNIFFDINKLPVSEGIILFGISMSRIGNAQSAKKCFEYLKHLASKIQHTDGIGMVVLYGDYLYFNSNDPAYTLRDKFKSLMVSHKNAFLNLLKKDRKWTHKAFSFTTFGQLLLDNSDTYQYVYNTVLDLYKNDPVFRKYVEEDGKDAGHGVGEREAIFILEEITLFYLSQKGVFRLSNRFVTDAEKTWTLQAYPGGYLKSEVYLFRKNPLGLSNPKNQYEHYFYDLDKKLLYDYDRINLDA